MVFASSQLTWYVARSSGIVAWALLTAGIVWGLALSTRLVRGRGASARLLDVHTFLGSLAVVFIAIHLLALWADTFVYFGPRELFVPMASTWRPGAVAWGIVAMYLLVAVQVTSWLRRHMPRRVWHTIHLTSIPLFVLATVHGFTAGADRSNALMQWGAFVGTLLVVWLLMLRVIAPRRTPARRPRAEPATAG